ncbi:hypothetical protein EUGRSUZ_G00196 [Eucalyptus grandis]|uniref:Uncharacterized protein n=2 Tax=Eucalyptus grandis TaxID=71139 RepID=A0ACC3K031_EUCGR|nr:hypothetical protein EUGRSUZ_G00196 [Eucalyptus grandis]
MPQSLNEEDGNGDESVPTEAWSSLRKQKPYSEASHASNSKPNRFICEICFHRRMSANLFWIKGCSHAYYIHCIAKYAISKLDNNMTRIDCPVSGYDGVLETEYCRLILSPEVFNHWGITLCRAGILEDKRFYCPHKDCLALLIYDQGMMVVMEWECPNCRRLFCAQYNVSWHARMECHEF